MNLFTVLSSVLTKVNLKKLVKIINLIENDDPHDLALNDNDTPLVVDAHATWMLKNVGTKLTNELAVLVVDLDLLKVKKAFL